MEKLYEGQTVFVSSNLFHPMWSVGLSGPLCTLFCLGFLSVACAISGCSGFNSLWERLEIVREAGNSLKG